VEATSGTMPLVVAKSTGSGSESLSARLHALLARWSWTAKARLQLGLGGCEVPQHLDQRVGQGVEVDVEFAVCISLALIQTVVNANVLSTSFLVYVSLVLLSWTRVTTWSRSSSLNFWSPSASFSMSTFLSRRFFFLAASLLRTPFASAGPDSARSVSSSGLGLRNV
jgi:hypothetical protein